MIIFLQLKKISRAETEKNQSDKILEAYMSETTNSDETLNPVESDLEIEPIIS